MPESVILRRCWSCKETKPIFDFANNKSQPLGKSYVCCPCRNAYYHKHRDKLLSRANKYSKLERVRLRRNELDRIRYKDYEVRNKRFARAFIKEKVQSGQLVRPKSCNQCGQAQIAIQAHHYLGYEKENWSDIKWLCKECHTISHHPASENHYK